MAPAMIIIITITIAAMRRVLELVVTGVVLVVEVVGVPVFDTDVVVEVVTPEVGCSSAKSCALTRPGTITQLDG